ncbi:MAG: ribonuclease Y [Candidatus Paceibacterota bacterium]|jgi:ribonuclease Y|nr:ribonuclease Y [Candidatus Paceibacterota bacterium]MDD3548599.1 ribonuclease Y [Candidatus Paceibacterota bacterium]MDD4999018.1 ribonuclease Y [Candidatus Paceibacterota bacterium]MDD5545134.1 ribonuclease Y [Candidatus Paceibacterota bacterium]
MAFLNFGNNFGIGILSLGVGVIFGYLVRQAIAQRHVDSIEAKLKIRIERVREEAKKTILEAQEKATKILEEIKNEEKKRKAQISKLEERSLQRESLIDKRQLEIDEREKEVKRALEKSQNLKIELEKLHRSELETLEKIAGLSVQEAKEELIKKIEKEYKEEIMGAIKKLEQFRKEEIEKKAKDIMVEAIQRYARSSIGEFTTTTVDLPSEDIKGRIIGREGRNIRHFEKITGVELIMDDSPGSIILSSFDPVRREIGRLTLEKLIQDGRIQPARIEEKAMEAQSEIRERIKKAGEDAVYETGIIDLPSEVIYLLGRLNFRTSYGQNALVHSIEVSQLAGALAAELGANVELAKKAGLLHDIGKAVDQEIEGTHLELGRKILIKYNLPEEVIKAMQAHHDTYPIETIEAAIINAADAISASRPGARKDSLEAYLKRLSNLEEIATSYPGVEKAYAISAGREIRVFVFPEKINDLEAMNLAKEIAKRLEETLNYPGEIKITVIRETRAIEIAR